MELKSGSGVLFVIIRVSDVKVKASTGSNLKLLNFLSFFFLYFYFLFIFSFLISPSNKTEGVNKSVTISNHYINQPITTRLRIFFSKNEKKVCTTVNLVG